MKLGRLLLQGLKNPRRRKPKRARKKQQKRRLPSFLSAAKDPVEAPGQNPGAPAPQPPTLPTTAVASVSARKPAQTLPTQPRPPEAQPIPTPSSGIETGELLRPGGRLRDSIEAFLLDQRSPHTRKAYGKDLKRFVQFLHGRNLSAGPERITRGLLISYKEYLLSEKLQHTSVDRHLATLRSFFRWLLDDGLIDKNPAEGVRFLNPKKVSTTVGLSDEEVRKILAQPDLHMRTGAQHYAILMVLFHCGLRRSELCELRTRQISMERGKRVLKLRGKGNSERLIVMIDPVWNALAYAFRMNRRAFDEDQFLFTPLRNNRTGERERAIDPSAVFYIVRKYAKKAGIESRISPHSCRATAISNARDHKVPDRAIQEFAGWASPDMITRYDKRRTAVDQSAAFAIDYGNADRVDETKPGDGV